MSRLRFALRLLLALAVTLRDFLAAALGAAVYRRSPRRRGAWRDRVLRRWGRSMLAAFGGRLEVAGTPPSPPFLLVSNHVSYVDIFVCGAAVPGSFVAKTELGGDGMVGAVCRSGGVVFIDRAAKRDLLRVKREVERELAAGSGVLIFLEGTTGSGRELLPFKPSMLEVAAVAQLPVHYATISYETPPGAPPASELVCWWGDVAGGDHARRLLAARGGFTARISFGPTPVHGDDRKQLAAHLREAMTARFTPCA